MRVRSRLLSGLAFIVACALAACGGGGSSSDTPPTQAPGLLAISASPRTEPPPTATDFIAAIDQVREAGARASFISYTWSKLEPQPEVYDLRELEDAIAYQGRTRGLTLFLGIQMINTVRREVPADLANTPWDAPQMRTRFQSLLDQIIPLFGNSVRYVSLGNEVDVYLEQNPQEWATFQLFFEEAAAYLRARVPGLRVGVTATFDGINGAAAVRFAALNATSDVTILTYYPLTTDFTVRPSSAPATDFPRMLQIAGGKPIVLQEVGYPADALNTSSEAAQAEFVRNVFAEWRGSNGRIALLNYFLLHDIPDSLCDELARYYGVVGDGGRFRSYLCTLGLKRADGAERAAWAALKDAAGASGISPLP